MSLRAEVWTRPGDPAYQRRIAEPPISDGGITRGYSGVGSGNFHLPKNYSRLREILYTDPTTPVNGVWSTIRVFDDAQWVYDWLPSPRIPAQNKNDPDTEVSGNGIESILGWGIVEPWDWDGSVSFVSTFPNWVYGGRNLLNNPGFEDSVCRPEVNQITLDPTVSGGTFTLSDGTDTTSALAWNASAFDIETELEADITAIDDVVVTGSGQEDDPWVIEFVTPCEFAGGLTANFASLTPAPEDSALVRTQFGALQPNPWTKSQVVSSGTDRIFGEYSSFRVTTAQAHTGIFTLLIDPALIGRRFAGAQQLVTVKDGGIYQASVWVYTASASQEYRLVIRGIDEDLMLDTSGNPAIAQVTPTANTWTQISIPDVVAQGTTLIFRVANINVSGNPAIFYVDDGDFAEGQPPATVGLMFGDLYDAWTDPTLRTPIMWDDGSATPYLTLDFSDTVDSDGVAWLDSHSLTFTPRLTGLQVLAKFADLGYEWRVIPDVIATGTYLLQLYNPQALGEVEPAAILGGAADLRNDARYFSPSGTALTVQAAGQLTARAEHADLITKFGRIETTISDQDITSSPDALNAATEGIASFNRGAESLVYTIRPQSGQQRPFVNYDPGDTISIVDPEVIDDTRRVNQIELAWNLGGAEYTVYLGSVALVGQSNTNNMVNILWDQFKRVIEPVEANPFVIGGSGGVPRVVVGAFNASSMSQAKSDFVGDGVADSGIFEEAIAGLPGELRVTEGRVNLGLTVFTFPAELYITGAGREASELIVDAIGTIDWTFTSRGGFRFISVEQDSG